MTLEGKEKVAVVVGVVDELTDLTEQTSNLDKDRLTVSHSYLSLFCSFGVLCLCWSCQVLHRFGRL